MGTASLGNKNGKKNSIRCRRCGKSAYHIKKKVCASCGFGDSPRLRHYNWQKSDK